MQIQDWHQQGGTLKETLGLTTNPVGLYRTDHETAGADMTKTRICRAIMDAAAGKDITLCKTNNACFGAVWHLGFHKIKDPEILNMTKKFVVEGEKLFSSYEALDKLIAQMGAVPDHEKTCFRLMPLTQIDRTPELVLVLGNAEQVCRLLTLVTFVDGIMPKIKIGGPTCRMAVVNPLLTGEVNVSFYDYTARKICHVPPDQLLVSIPAKSLPSIIKSIPACTAGTAKIEYPQDFKQFLQKRQQGAKKH